MPSPSYEDRLCAMFDSFCKKVSRHFLTDLLRAYSSRSKYCSNEPVEYLLDLIGHTDIYPSSCFVLYVEGYACPISDEILFKALQSLPTKQRRVLLLGFWRGLTDKEIARKMGVTVRTVYNLRQRAFRAIKSYYGEK